MLTISFPIGSSRRVTKDENISPVNLDVLTERIGRLVDELKSERPELIYTLPEACMMNSLLSLCRISR